MFQKGRRTKFIQKVSRFKGFFEFSTESSTRGPNLLKIGIFSKIITECGKDQRPTQLSFA